VTAIPAADAALASALRISVFRLARRLRAQQADDTLSPTQLAALATLERHGPLTPTELAEHEKVQPPSMTRVIVSLEALGLASRTSHPSDRRQALVAITPSGAARLQGDRHRREAWLAHRLAELSSEDRQVLAQAARVLDRLGQA
jgi:DNA-binding MarR family transcriptional regulator